MEPISKDMMGLLYGLLPGFVAAWIFYGLTAHPKPSPFERVVQALIFTVVIHAINILVCGVLTYSGRYLRLGIWTDDTALVSSLIIAVISGMVVVRFANSNRLHEWLATWGWYERLREKKGFGWLPEWQWTSRTSYPSEWYSAFTREKRKVVLHFKNGRRLSGWPEEWPDQPERGHFVIDNAEWLLDNGEVAQLLRVEKILIPADEVEMVEFLRWPEEITAAPEDLVRVQELLVQSQQKGQANGSQVSTKADNVPR